VSSITEKVMSRFGVMIVFTSRVVGFQSQMSIPDHFPISVIIAECGILLGLSAFLILSPPDFYKTLQND